MSRVSLYEAASGLLHNSKVHEYIANLAYKTVIVTDDNVKALYADTLKTVSQDIISIPPGEQSKTRSVKAKIEDQLFELNCGRDTCLVALGGGVVTDLTGYVAATYCRGVPVVYFPTTLLAMVDAAIGGKNGINTRYGKNLVGTIVQPKAIFADIDCLATLDKAQFSYGMAEVIKHALIADAGFFEFLETTRAPTCLARSTKPASLI